MANIEWIGADKLRSPENSGPEKYAPPQRRPQENLSDLAHDSANFVEDAPVRRAGSAARTLNDLIRRVAGESMDEIDRVIGELESVRDILRNEGERVSREIAGYASLSHAAKTAMTVIADSLKQWNETPGRSEPRAVTLTPEPLPAEREKASR